MNLYRTGLVDRTQDVQDQESAAGHKRLQNFGIE